MPSDAEERARKVAANQSTFRTANERMSRLAAEHRFEPAQRVPFRCECADMSCHEVVMLSLDEYEAVREHPRRFFLAAGHEDPDLTHERIVESEQGYAIVEKVGVAGAEAARQNPRHSRLG